MARRFVELVFDEVIHEADYYTSTRHDLLLGSCSRLALHVVADQVVGTTDLTVSAEQSLDGRGWPTVNPAGTPEINRATLAPNGTTSVTGAVSYSAPRFGRMRLRIFLIGAGSRARVKVYATGRDRA